MTHPVLAELVAAGGDLADEVGEVAVVRVAACARAQGGAEDVEPLVADVPRRGRLPRDGDRETIKVMVSP